MTTTQQPEPGFRVSRVSLWLTYAAALLSLAGCVVGLVAPTAVYADETELMRDAATAQDLVGLAVVVPLLVGLALLASRGSLASWLCCLGGLAFTAYNYAIYSFSIHFGPLFLVWVAVLGLALFALVTGLVGLHPAPIRARFGDRRQRLTGWFLVAVAAVFTLVWLSEIVPDLVAGRASTSAADWQVPTNPVHVLDLAFLLPAVCASGLLLLRRHWLGYATAPAQLVFLALTCLPILLIPVVASSRDHVAAWAVAGPIGVIATATLACCGGSCARRPPRHTRASRTRPCW